MKKLVSFAVKNLFRNKRRTIITGIPVVLGVFILINAFGYVQGMQDSMENTVIKAGMENIEIHQKGYIQALTDRTVSGDYAINENQVDTLIKQTIPNDQITNISKRVIANVAIENGTTTTNAFCMGIEPEHEKNVMNEMTISSGEKITSDTKGKILVSDRIKRVLGTKPGDELTVTLYSANKAPIIKKYEVSGTFDSGIQFTFRNIPEIYMSLSDAKELIGISQNSVCEVAVDLKDRNTADFLTQNMNTYIENNSLNIEAHSWRVLGKELLEIINYFHIGISAWMVVLFVVILFVIINTFIMSFYERIYEVGIMKAIGIKKRRILGQFILESVLLGILSAIVGFILSGISLTILNKIGLPGIPVFMAKSERLYPTIDWTRTIITLAASILISSVAGLYPANKAANMNPVDALRNE